MADRIVEGLWDCKYCGTRQIGGLTKHCPNCGHPQDTDTRFYLGEAKHYLEDDIAKQYGQGPDWLCAYCGSLNRYHFQYCQNCGAAKAESQYDYFTNQAAVQDSAQGSTQYSPQASSPAVSNLVKNQDDAQLRQRILAGNQKAVREAARQRKTSGTNRKQAKTSADKTQSRLRSLAVPLGVLTLLIASLLTFLLLPRTATVTVTDKAWERSVEVEDYKTVQESDWSVPSGGRVYDTRQEIHHYDQVLDHYETKSRTVTEQVLDGYDTETYYSDNGDGTFTEQTRQTPRYTTETRTEYYEDPVYVSVPVYQTKYYYEIERWLTVRTETSSGSSEEPYWPELNLTGLEREGDRTETYSFTGQGLKRNKTYQLRLPYEQWSSLTVGDKLTVTYKLGGRVTKINGIPLED